MEIRQISENKRSFLPLLLLGDEQESMIEQYLDRGELFALYEGNAVLAVCVVTDEGGGLFELKNLAVSPSHQRRGLGRSLVEFAARHCRGLGGKTLLAGTGDSPLTLPFYHACGFRELRREPGYFLRHYALPIFEGGRQLIDRVELVLAL